MVVNFTDPAVPGSSLIMPVHWAPGMEAAGAPALASAAAAAGPEDAEAPQTEAAVRAKPKELPAFRAKRIPG